MERTHDANTTPTADEGAGLDAREAAALLDEARRRAQRQLEPQTPLVSLVGGAAILVAYGAIWLSVRGQNPYLGPSLAALGVTYAAVIVNAVFIAATFQRARAGIGGRSQRQGVAFAVAYGSALTAVYVFQGALLYNGASHAIVYGVWAAAAPIIVIGTCGAVYTAVRENWAGLAFSVGAIALATGAAFAGPVGVWAVIGVVGCLGCLGFGAGKLLRRRG